MKKILLLDMPGRSFCPILSSCCIADELISNGFDVKHIDLSIHTLEFLRKKDNFNRFLHNVKREKKLSSILICQILTYCHVKWIKSKSNRSKYHWLIQSLIFGNTAEYNFTDKIVYHNFIWMKLLEFFVHIVNISEKLRPCLFSCRGYVDFIQEKPDIVAFSTRYLNHLKVAEELSHILKSKIKVTTVVGGYSVKHFTSLGYKPKFLDFLVTETGNSQLNKIFGKPIDLHKLGSMKTNFYIQLIIKYSRVYGDLEYVYYETSRGCKWRKCAFCSFIDPHQGFQEKDISIVISDIKKIINDTGYNRIWYINDFMTYEYADLLTSKLIENEVKTEWITYFRFDRRINKVFLKKLRKSGCISLRFGLESGDQNVNDLLEKGVNIEEASRILRICHEVGIQTTLLVMVGFPFEKLQQLVKTYSFARSHAKYISTMQVGKFCLIPNSKIANYPSKYGISSINLEKYTFDYPGKKIREFQINLLNVYLYIILRLLNPKLQVNFS